MPRRAPASPDAALLANVRRGAAAARLLGPAVARARAPGGTRTALVHWLRSGHHGEMAYMARRGGHRAEPRSWIGWARSVALFAESYDFRDAPQRDPSRANIARYARGSDYHLVLKDKIEQLCALIRRGGRRAAPFVDTSPVMEKALAAAAGLGWIGKNGNLLREGVGSYFFIGGLVTDAVWRGSGTVPERCGTCSDCLTACPTGAIVSPGVVDARLCISYLTIELKGSIPRPLRPLVGNRVFGCDDCQEACPWNRFAAPAPDPAYRARHGLDAPALIDLAGLTEQEFFERFRGTPVRRARWRGLLRNVMVALGNWGRPEALPALEKGIRHPEALVREHAAWALGRIGGQPATQLLQARLAGEDNQTVRGEIELSLAEERERLRRRTSGRSRSFLTRSDS